MLTGHSTSKKQGDAGLGIAIAWFASHRMPVSIPLTDSQEYDLVVDVEEELKKVQVKTTSYKNKYGNYEVDLRTATNTSTRRDHKNMDLTKIDFVFIVCNDGALYLIPSEKMESVSRITLGKKYAEFKVGIFSDHS